MRCYVVATTDNEGNKHQAFASTNATAKEQRDQYVEAYGVKKSEVDVSQTDVPLAKAQLLSFMNELLTGNIPDTTKETKDEKPAKSAKPVAKATKASAAKAGRGASSNKK